MSTAPICRNTTPNWAKFIAFVIGVVLSAATIYLGLATHQTSERLKDIEETRLVKERRDAAVADFVGTFFAAQCDVQIKMEKFPLLRAAGIQTPVRRDYVQRYCDRIRDNEPTRILERYSVVGDLGPNKARVFAALRYANDGREVKDTGEILYVDLLLERPSDSAPFKVRSLAEVTAHA